MKQFTKDDLRSGMVVELRDGHKYLVMRDAETLNYGKQDFVAFDKTSFIIGSDYDDNLNFSTKDFSDSEDYDIVKVYKTYVHGLEGTLRDSNLEPIYDANAKSPVQLEIEQLKAERDEFNRKMDERLAKLENI